jgi:thiosulfate/3-mercaptopyruvate sulfurtransferase
MFELLLVAGLAAMIPGPAPVPAPDIVVSAQWLKAHVNDPDLVILDLTMSGMYVPDPYNAGHVPGSRPLDFHSILTGDGTNGSLSMELVSADSLRHVLEQLGVTDRSTIVLYSTPRWLSVVARTYVTLDYLGLGARTHILDGGYAAWKTAGGTVDTVMPVIKPGSLHLTPKGDVVTNGAYVQAHLADRNTTIVDARAPEFYTGTARGHSAVRNGHVAGAHNVYFLTLTDSTANTFLSTDQARARFASAGVPLDRPVVVYCHIGQTASVDYVQLKRLGVPVRLYDGSFEDWSRHTDYPVTTGDKP